MSRLAIIQRMLCRLTLFICIVYGLLLNVLIIGADVASPKRIVSISPVMTEILYAIGAGDYVVGATRWCNTPDAAKALPRVGDSTISIETVASLEPDVVLGLGNGESLEYSFKRWSIPATIYHSPRSVDDIFSVISQVADRVNRRASADELLSQLKIEVADIQSQTPSGSYMPNVLMIVWTPPYMSVGKRTFLSDMIRIAGGKNIMDDSDVSFPKISREIIVKRAPDVILLTSPDYQEIIAQDQVFSRTRAGQLGHMYVSPDPDIFSRAGPRFIHGLRLLRNIISRVPPPPPTPHTDRRPSLPSLHDLMLEDNDDVIPGQLP